MVFDIETGRIRLTASGDDAFIVRKGKKIKIPSVESGAEKKNSKLEEGDTVISGSKTIINIEVSYNKGKENPIDDWKSRASKDVGMGPNSELSVSGFEEWDKTDKDKKRHHGELIKNIELKKGFFYVSYSNTDDALITPVALVKFMGNGGSGGSFDVYENILYSNAVTEKGVEYTNISTKKSFIAKSSVPTEIIVTQDAIYKKGMLRMDDIFSPLSSIGIMDTLKGVALKSVPEMDAGKMAEQYKNMLNTMDQVAGGFEMFGQMSPDDLERMMKMGEAHGAKITPEARKQMKELPEAMKAMGNAGYMGKMKEAMAMGKGFMEGLGGEGLERLAKMQTKGMAKMKQAREQMGQISVGEGKTASVETILESPRKYKPLNEDAKKVA